MDDFNITTAFSLDSSRNCIVPCGHRGDQTPTMLEERLLHFRKRSDAYDVTSSALASYHAPFWVPRRNVVQYKTVDSPVPVIMSPPPGYLTNHYNFGEQDEEDPSLKLILECYLMNQFVARSWEMTRQTLEELGANVVVTEPVGFSSTKPYQPYSTECGAYSIQVFTRDTGFIVGDTFYYGTTDIDRYVERFLKERRIINSQDSELREEWREFFSLQSAMTDEHAQAIVEAYRKAGVTLSMKKIDAHLEGGDILVDWHKGCIFVGRETEHDFIQQDEDELAHKLAEATGADIVQIDRDAVLHNSFDPRRGGAPHIDLLMSPLPNGEMLYDPRHTTVRSSEQLHNIYGDDLLRIGKDNPLAMRSPFGDVAEIRPANLVIVGQTLLMPSCSDALRQDLTKRGYAVVSPQTLKKEPNIFCMQGGSLHCITHTLT